MTDPSLVTNFARARKLLVNMPDDLFTLYMEPLIKEYGWPFYSLESPTKMPWWQLFDGLPFKTICELSWKRQEIPFSPAIFHRYAQRQILGLLQTHILGMHTEYADIPNTKARFSSARSYIGGTFRMPVPVVLVRDVEGLRILDGNHRLGAMASLAMPAAALLIAGLEVPDTGASHHNGPPNKPLQLTAR